MRVCRCDPKIPARTLCYAVSLATYPEGFDSICPPTELIPLQIKTFIPTWRGPFSLHGEFKGGHSQIPRRLRPKSRRVGKGWKLVPRELLWDLAWRGRLSNTIKDGGGGAGVKESAVWTSRKGIIYEDAFFFLKKGLKGEQENSLMAHIFVEVTVGKI